MSSNGTIVTLVVVYGDQPVRIRVNEDIAQQAVVHSQSGIVALHPFYGTDAHGQPFTVYHAFRTSPRQCLS